MANLQVYVFWDSNNDPKRTARAYCDCVRSSPAVASGCSVACDLVDTISNPAPPALEFWSKTGTIEVVTVKDNARQEGKMNPSLDCVAVHEMVGRLCS